ncbi:MAG: glycoside hydrolase 43 family protein [Bacteroidales bacterium]|nr:glycoside hydrolase 43 family protein [Bacteroidales bacterium]
MRRSFFSCLFLLGAVAAAWAQSETPKLTWGDQGTGTYVNPILNADYSDPDVIRVGKTYYMVASDFHYMGMQVLASKDMVNFEIVGQIYTQLDFPEYNTNGRYAGGSWAPSLRYHDGKFWVFFCTPDEGLFMTSAKHPQGPWAPLHQVKAVKGWEDPCPLWDKDGQAYLGRSQHGAGPIIVHRMTPDGKQLLDEGQTVYTGPVAEGTKFLQHNGYYYLSIPEGGVGEGWQTVLRSRSIYGPYERKVVLEQGSTKVNGPHQGALVDTPKGDWWFYHFQHTGTLGRVVHLQPVQWKEDWPEIGIDQDGNGIGEPVSEYKMPLKSKGQKLPQTSDSFTAEKLSPQWQWNHNADAESWSLTEQPGALVLQALPSATFKNARNTITQKVIGYDSEVTIAMDVSGMLNGDRAGLAVLGKPSELAGVYKKNNKYVLFFGRDDLQQLGEEVQTIYLRLRLDVSAKKFRFFFSGDGQDFKPMGWEFFSEFVYWKGVRWGIFNYNTDLRVAQRKQKGGQVAVLNADYRILK